MGEDYEPFMQAGHHVVEDGTTHAGPMTPETTRRPFCNTWPFASSDLDIALEEDNDHVHKARGCCDGWLPRLPLPVPHGPENAPAGEHHQSACVECGLPMERNGDECDDPRDDHGCWDCQGVSSVARQTS